MTVFRPNEAGIAAILRSPAGAVGRDLYRRGLRVQGAAQQLCPVGTPESTGKRGYRGGTLRGSIAVELVVTSSGLACLIGTNVEYGLYVHEGTYKMAGRPFLRDALPAAR